MQARTRDRIDNVVTWAAIIGLTVGSAIMLVALVAGGR